MRIGARERRWPSPVFDSGFYSRINSDVQSGIPDPLMHFIEKGNRENRSPHPEFNAVFYCTTYADVATSGLGAFEHFVLHGAAEGRLPGPDFDPDFYMAHNPEVAAMGLSAPDHWLRLGASRQIQTRPVHSKADFLPVADPKPPLPRVDTAVAVVIPAYRGLDQTRRCIESVLGAQCRIPSRFIVVDDCSPEPALSDYLRSLAATGAITLIHNETNQGFVRSVNSGMRAASEDDVVLLNSDTEVANDWLDRLCAHAYRGPKVATVTPFSNNATICSYPTMRAAPTFPAETLHGWTPCSGASTPAGRRPFPPRSDFACTSGVTPSKTSACSTRRRLAAATARRMISA